YQVGGRCNYLDGNHGVGFSAELDPTSNIRKRACHEVFLLFFRPSLPLCFIPRMLFSTIHFKVVLEKIRFPHELRRQHSYKCFVRNGIQAWTKFSKKPRGINLSERRLFEQRKTTVARLHHALPLRADRELWFPGKAHISNVTFARPSCLIVF